MFKKPFSASVKSGPQITSFKQLKEYLLEKCPRDDMGREIIKFDIRRSLFASDPQDRHRIIIYRAAKDDDSGFRWYFFGRLDAIVALVETGFYESKGAKE